jgi:hypothetical protein
MLAAIDRISEMQTQTIKEFISKWDRGSEFTCSGLRPSWNAGMLEYWINGF